MTLYYFYTHCFVSKLEKKVWTFRIGYEIPSLLFIIAEFLRYGYNALKLPFLFYIVSSHWGK